MNKKAFIRTLALLTAVAQLLLITHGCGVCKRNMLTEQVKGTWQITQIGDLPITAEEGKMTFSLDMTTKMAGGMGMCNSYGGTFTLDSKGNCSFADIYSTRVGCPGNRIESLLNEQLYKSKKLVLKGNQLHFFDNEQASGSPLIVMQKKK